MAFDDAYDLAPTYALAIIQLQSVLPLCLFLQCRDDLQAVRIHVPGLDRKHSLLDVDSLLMLANRQVYLGNRFQYIYLVDVVWTVIHMTDMNGAL